jgi:DnaJ-class molecular chaperone
MKRIEEQTYYEILEISSKATSKEIQRAYERAKETFHTDSLAVYSLFSEGEINKIQSAIEEAYRALIDETLRKNYDQSHLQESKTEKREEVPEVLRIQGEEKESLAFTDLSIQTGEVAYRGKTLRQIRERMGVELKSIAAETKINIKILEWIEEETIEKLPTLVYLKGFLKGYAKFLGLDSPKVVDNYLQLLTESKKK